MTGSFVVICYDVADAARRARVARVLEAHGRRVQRSVFEASLQPALFDNLVAELDALLDPTEDVLAVYRVCAACAGRRRTRGPAESGWPGQETAYVI